MAKNKIEDLRNLLMEAMERLMDDEKPLDVEHARAVADVAKVVLESARVEIAFMRDIGGIGTGFVPVERNELDDKLAPKELRAVGAK